MTRSHRLAMPAVLVGCLLGLPTPGHAFKIDTHLWIGQQVINDLEDDGRITVKLHGRAVSLPVPARVRDAILAHRNEYLLGHLGPDVFPDVVVGQTLVHPGSATGWKTNDWLLFLLARSEGDPLATALAYGSLGHAAGDLFAHSYVNQYAGDIFELSDETLVEQRHVALESFVARFNPPFRNAAGQDLGDPSRLARPGDEVARFVRDALIYDEQAAEQNRNGRFGAHLAAYRSYRNAVKSAADDSLWREIDAAVAQVVAAYFGIQITADEAGALVSFLNDEVIPRVQSRVDLTQDQVDRLNRAINRFDAAHFDALNDALRQTASLNSAIAERLARRAEAEGRLCRTVSEQVCRFVACCIVPKPFGGCLVEDPLCRQVCDTVTRLHCEFGEAAGQAAADLIRRIDEELNGPGGLSDQLLQSVGQLRDQALATHNASLDLAQRLIDLQQVVGNDTSPVKALLANWVSELDTAMAAYVQAAANTMINTIDPTASALRPMVEWWDCYHLTMVGVPAPVGTGRCGFRGSLERVFTALESTADILEDVAWLAPSRVAGLPSPAQIREEIERLEARAIRELQDAAIDALVDILPQEVQDLLAVLDEDMTEERLRYYFTKPESASSKGLLMIGDIERRVKAEMQLVEDGPTARWVFDAERYAVVYDAVVLSKLALLDEEGLALLASEAGAPRDTSGAELFAGTANLLADSLTSMDGNHQWMTVAPPRPGRAAPYRPAGPGPGYPHPDGYASAAGFVPWKAEARAALFRGLFIGPLSPGVESPGEIGLPELLPADYPYRPCRAYPFPNDANDRTCAGLKGLATILGLLLEN